MNESGQISGAEYDLPMVSVLISNYNYSKYLKQCAYSVLSQSYPDIECIIVDDLSTDDSGNILDELKAEHPAITIIRRHVNGGQSAAALDALEICKGDFVIFLDADDFLLPKAVACHVQTHISLRFPVGFTCGDMLQLSERALISRASMPFNMRLEKQRSAKGSSERVVRAGPLDLIGSDMGTPDELFDRIEIIGSQNEEWVWSATSAMMFRRDALKIWEGAKGLRDLRYSIDAFFCFGINLLTGSALIDMPLAAYRIHGKNGFVSGLPLKNVRNFQEDSAGERSLDAVRLIKKELLENQSYFKTILWSHRELRILIVKLNKIIYQIERRDKDVSVFSSIWARVQAHLSR